MVKAWKFSGWQVASALVALVLVVGPKAAQADPRDQVVVGVMHCAAITDPQQWLQCFYGAAQPMRAYLNLPPAPQSQQQLLQRYYSPSAGDAAALAPSSSGQQTASRLSSISGPPPMPGKRGLFSNFLGGDPFVVNAPLKDYSINSNGTFVVTLGDGQVWQQDIGDVAAHSVHWTEPASSIRVTIRPGALRTYNLLVNGNEGVHYKVSRLR